MLSFKPLEVLGLIPLDLISPEYGHDVFCFKEL